jgi:hypothetical protein
MYRWDTCASKYHTYGEVYNAFTMPSPLKWIISYLDLFVIAALWGFGLTMVGTGDFTAAEWLIALGNLLLLIRIVLSPQLDHEGYRPALIFLVLVVVSAVSFGEWFWIENKRVMAESNHSNPIQAAVVPAPISGGSRGTNSGNPSTPKGILPPNATPVPPPSRTLVPKKLPRANPPSELEPHLSKKKRALDTSNEIGIFLEERKRSEPMRSPVPITNQEEQDRFNNAYKGWGDETSYQFRLRFATPIGQVIEDVKDLGLQTGGLEVECRVMSGNTFAIRECADSLAHVADLLPD